MSQLLQLAVVAHQAGNFDEAERLYGEVLRSEPNQPDAMALLGVLRGIKGNFGDALLLIEKAIQLDPNSALLKFHYGNVLMGAANLPQAINSFRDSIKIRPNFIEAHYNLANALRAVGDWTAAIKSYLEAIKLNPSYHEAYNNLALCYVHEKEYEQALQAAQSSIKIAPDYGEAWVTLCNVAEKIKNYQLALESGKKAIDLMPQNHFSWFGYGVVLNRLDRNEEAIVAYRKALELKPERTDIWDNLGQTYQSLNRLDEAEEIYHKTIESAGQIIDESTNREIREEEYGNRHWHLALIELLQGKYINGFSRYRSRFKEIGGLKRPNLSKPLWMGEEVKGKTLLVCDEQGYGDALMLCRYLPLLKDKGANIIFSVHPVLKQLFDNWYGADRIIVHGSVVGYYDYYASIFDLPHRFKTTLNTIPAKIPYLPIQKPDTATQLIKSDRPKVGVVWGGNPLHANDQRRSIPLTIFSKLFSEKNCEFYSFNRDMKFGESNILSEFQIEDLTPRINNFSDSAKFLNQMDLVITCDTSTAHLAGGLGYPTWVMLPYAPDWRWLTNRSDSPWYPTIRLFRQPVISDWEGVVNEVSKELTIFCRQFTRCFN